jgi:hypothetical protein
VHPRDHPDAVEVAVGVVQTHPDRRRLGERRLPGHRRHLAEALTQHRGDPPGLVGDLLDDRGIHLPVVGQCRDQATQDRDPMAEPQDLLQLGRDEQHRYPAAGQLDDQSLDLGLRPDVDPAGRHRRRQVVRAGLHPAHRAAQLPRQPAQHRVLGTGAVLRLEPTADARNDHSDLRPVQPEHPGQRTLVS